MHLQGPPGTGKTLLLMLRILVWLDEGHKVWIISFFPPSRSVTHVLFEQVRSCSSGTLFKAATKISRRGFDWGGAWRGAD